MDNGLTILNMTNFFNRELFLYSLGDLKLRKPVSLKKAAYVVAFLVIWTLPFMLLTGFRLDITLYPACLHTHPSESQKDSCSIGARHHCMGLLPVLVSSA